jgi:hypothetical protein
MSVAFARAFVDGMRYNGVHVDFEPGWETRGNGQTFPNGQPDGELTHHTGAPYGGGYSVLVHGRSDLPGPLCNISTWPTAPAGYVGHITVIAAHPANHAGAAGGSWARPFPDTRNFNRLVWGNEVMYPGFQPWTAAQYRTARIAAAVVCGIRRRGAEWARGHYETSVTGKWDPGIGNGRAEWFPMARFRREMPAALTPNPEDDMTPEEHAWLRAVHHEATLFLPNRREPGRDKERDTVLGFAASAEGRAYRLEKQVAGLSAAVQTLAAAVESQDGLSADELTAVIRDAMDEVVQVEISVREGETPKA